MNKGKVIQNINQNDLQNIVNDLKNISLFKDKDFVMSKEEISTIIGIQSAVKELLELKMKDGEMESLKNLDKVLYSLICSEKSLKKV